MSLLLGGMTAIAAAQSAALKSNEIFISHADPETESDLKAAAPEEAPVSAVYPDGEAKSVAEDVWKPQLQIQLQMTVVEEATQQPGQAPGPPRQFGAHVTAPQFASVYCDNISVNIISTDGSDSEYSLSCKSPSHVRVVGLQIDCDSLEIEAGQLTMTNVRINQHGQLMTTEKLSMSLPVFGVTTTKFAKPLTEPLTDGFAPRPNAAPRRFNAPGSDSREPQPFGSDEADVPPRRHDFAPRDRSLPSRPEVKPKPAVDARSFQGFG